LTSTPGGGILTPSGRTGPVPSSVSTPSTGQRGRGGGRGRGNPSPVTAPQFPVSLLSGIGGGTPSSRAAAPATTPRGGKKGSGGPKPSSSGGSRGGRPVTDDLDKPQSEYPMLRTPVFNAEGVVSARSELVPERIPKVKGNVFKHKVFNPATGQVGFETRCKVHYRSFISDNEKSKKVQHHKELCEMGRSHCPFEGCNYKGTRWNLFRHIRSIHRQEPDYSLDYRR